MKLSIGQIITHDGETWRIDAMGVTVDGKTYCGLTHTTKGFQQRNGFRPRMIHDWIENPEAEDESN
jgi:hypothetical protein